MIWFGIAMFAFGVAAGIAFMLGVGGWLGFWR